MRDEMDIPIDEGTRARLNEAGHCRLNDKQLGALKEEIQEYVLHRDGELAIRPTKLRKKHTQKIEKNVRALFESFRDLRLELSSSAEQFDKITAMNDQIMLRFAGV